MIAFLECALTDSSVSMIVLKVSGTARATGGSQPGLRKQVAIILDPTSASANREDPY